MLLQEEERNDERKFLARELESNLFAKKKKEEEEEVDSEERSSHLALEFVSSPQYSDRWMIEMQRRSNALEEMGVLPFAEEILVVLHDGVVY